MAFTPDLPFPKSAGDPLRSKDWNDLVTEAQRLDTAKVERSGDAITGGLSIAGALAVGKANAGAGVVADFAGPLAINDANLQLRGAADLNHGLGWHGPGKAFATLEPDGPALYGHAGGLLGTTQGGQRAALTWNAAGQVGLSVPTPDFRLDVGGRIRLREAPDGSAGLWLYQSGPAGDRAFVGMAGDDRVGLWGNTGSGWGLSMNTTTGCTGIRTAPVNGYGLFINPGQVNANAPAVAYGLVIGGGATAYGLYVGGNVQVAGRVRETKVRSWLRWNNSVNTAARSWVDVPNMSTTVSSPDMNGSGAYFLIQVHLNGVQTVGNPTNVGAYFRLMVDGGQQDFTRHEFHNNGWELRGVNLSAMVYLTPGSHTISVQWYATGATLYCCWYGDYRQITILEQ